jgi:hypothetical protein
MAITGLKAGVFFSSSGLASPFRAHLEKAREFHGRPAAVVELAFDRMFVLTQDFEVAALDRAVPDIGQDFHFPRLKRIAGNGAAHQVPDQPLETGEHNLEFGQFLSHFNGNIGKSR